MYIYSIYICVYIIYTYKKVKIIFKRYHSQMKFYCESNTFDKTYILLEIHPAIRELKLHITQM